MALILTPALCLTPFQIVQKYQSQLQFTTSALLKAKKQRRACHAVMVCKQFSIMEPFFPNQAEMDAGTWDFCKAVCVPSCRRRGGD